MVNTYDCTVKFGNSAKTFKFEGESKQPLLTLCGGNSPIPFLLKNGVMNINNEKQYNKVVAFLTSIDANGNKDGKINYADIEKIQKNEKADKTDKDGLNATLLDIQPSVWQTKKDENGSSFMVEW